MRVGSLFAGIGGFDLGLERAGFEIAWQVEIDPYCQRVLAKHWPHVQRYGDIRTIDWGTVEPVDLLCGGFPCQDISLAGKGAGLAGERSGLWFEYSNAIEALQPRYVLIENVSALRSRGLDQVLGTLAALGYDAEWHCIPASAVGAPHRRDRIWVIGYEGWRCPADESFPTGSRGEIGDNALFPDPNFIGQQEQRQSITHDSRRELGRMRTQYGNWWATEPGMGRMAHGLPGRVDRLRALGNAIVPQIAEMIGRWILVCDEVRQ